MVLRAHSLGFVYQTRHMNNKNIINQLAHSMAVCCITAHATVGFLTFKTIYKDEYLVMKDKKA